MIVSLYDYFETHKDKLPAEQRKMIPAFGVNEVVKDHIAGMTDRYAVNLFKELYVPKNWR
jgi:dGTPase